MRYPAANQYPAPNSYPSAWWPPGIDAIVYGTLCDTYGVTVGSLLTEVGCPPTVVAAALPVFATVAEMPLQDTAVSVPAPSAVEVPDTATEADPVSATTTTLVSELDTAAVLVDMAARAVVPALVTVAGLPGLDTDATGTEVDTDVLDPAYELEVAC